MHMLNATVAAQPLPTRMLGRPISKRGFPVPWFVTERTDDGDWDFRALDPARYAEALRSKKCWVCGSKLGTNYAFTVGPMCCINRTTSEPPAHRECAEWSVKVCPFMLTPRARRNEKGLPEDVARGDYTSGLMIKRNPGVIAIWMTRGFKPFRVGNGMLITMGDPLEVSWWAEGRPATKAEVDMSVATGMPFLEEQAHSPADRRELHRYIKRAQPLFDAIPA